MISHAWCRLILPRMRSTSLASNHHIRPTECAPLLLHGIATSTCFSGKSVLQNAITGMFTYDASVTDCEKSYNFIYLFIYLFHHVKKQYNKKRRQIHICARLETKKRGKKNRNEETKYNLLQFSCCRDITDINIIICIYKWNEKGNCSALMWYLYQIE